MNMPTTNRKRLSWEERHRQMIGVALDFVRREGADSLTLAKVAEQAGVAKPLAYNHFKSREGLLVELCLAFDERQRAELSRLQEDSSLDLAGLARAVCESYLECYAKSEGEWHAIYSVMRSNGEMAKIQQDLFDKHVSVLVSVFGPKTPLTGEDLRLTCIGLIGAAETISASMTHNAVTMEAAAALLTKLYVAALEPSAEARTGSS
ncbi:TetR/AcrR family transcriptional regulator [Novosphingobium sp.]|uniref:TetR/AcrR family transcriptional regulator n=1 Tax=Novosphingobium sp. TaxID=1874826 RepID=UPI00301658DD